MNPKPLSSLNHFTVPVGISLPSVFCAANPTDAEKSNSERCHGLCRAHARLVPPKVQTCRDKPRQGRIFWAPACSPTAASRLPAGRLRVPSSLRKHKRLWLDPVVFGEGRKQGRFLRSLALALPAALLGLLAVAGTAQATVWFTNLVPGEPSIARANATGQVVDSTVVFADPSRTLSGLAVDGRHLYWSNSDTATPGAGNSSIGRATLNNAGEVIPS